MPRESVRVYYHPLTHLRKGLEQLNRTIPKGTLSRPLQFFVLYSFLIAAKGESFMARMAGYRPDMSATTIENTSAPTAR